MLQKIDFQAPDELKAVFPSLDNFKYKDKWWVLDFGGNNIRVLAFIQFVNKRMPQTPRHFTRPNALGSDPEFGVHALFELRASQRFTRNRGVSNKVIDTLRRRVGDEPPVTLRSSVWVRLKTQVAFMGRMESRPHSVSMASITGPLVIAGIGHNASLYRVQLDVALAFQKVAFGIDQAGFEPALPHSAGPFILVVEVLRIALTQRFHKRRQRLVGPGCHQ